MRYLIVSMALLISPLTPAIGQVSIQIGLPGVSIGISQPVYPQLVPVLGVPVYYAPGSSTNYFFYDGVYWVFQGDNWYASNWFDGPWALVPPQYVPDFVLRIPVSYYRNPPAYFREWLPDGPPRWGDHWGRDWERQHIGWDSWNRSAAPRPAPRPDYQKAYSGNRYPQQISQQRELRDQHYGYRPNDEAVRRVEQAHAVSHPQPQPAAPTPARVQQQQQPTQDQPREQKKQEQQQAQPKQQKKQEPQQAQPQQAPPRQQQQAQPQQAPPRQQQQAQPQQARAATQPAPQAAPAPRHEQGGQSQGNQQKGGQGQEKGGGDKGNSGQARAQDHGPDHEK